MKNKLSDLCSPVLAGVVREKTAKAAIAEIKNCIYSGAGMIDLHMSCLEKNDTETLREIISDSRLPVLALNYNQLFDFENAGLSEEERKTKVNQGILYSSGLIAGEGLVGILLAVFAIIPVGTATLGDAINLSKVINLGNIGGLVFFVALIALIAFINKKEKKTN